jgi:hypothetical protein
MKVTNFNKEFKEGETLRYQKGLWEVFDVRADALTIIPIVEVLERGEIKRKCDFERKPQVWDIKNVYTAKGK